MEQKATGDVLPSSAKATEGRPSAEMAAGDSHKPSAGDAADRVYFRAAVFTGWPEAKLRAMALKVFASMLTQAIEAKGKYVWTSIRIDGIAKEIDCEVGAGRTHGRVEIPS